MADLQNNKSRKTDIRFSADRGFYIKKTSDSIALSFFGFLVRFFVSAAAAFAVTVNLLNLFNFEYDFYLLLKVSAASSAFGALLCISVVLAVIGYGAIAAAIAFMAVKNYESVRVGIKYAANIAYGVVMKSLDMPQANGFDNVEAGEPMLVLLVIGFAVIVSLTVSFVVVRLRSAVLYAVGAAAVLGADAFFGGSGAGWNVAVLTGAFGALLGINLTGGRLRLFSRIKYKSSSIIQRADGIFVIQLAVIGIAISLIGGCAVRLIYSRNDYELKAPPKLNTDIRYTLRDIGTMLYVQHLDGVLMDNIGYGQLGFFSNVNVKFNDKLTIECEPIDEGKKLYLRNYIASDYIYRGNVWQQNAALENETAFNMIAAKLKEKGVEPKKIDINLLTENSLEYAYMPYYSDTRDNEAITYVNDNSVKSNAKEYTVEQYPIEAAEVKVDDSEYKDYVYSTYLNVDDKNKAVLDEIIRENGITADNIADKLDAYYRNNFVYDMNSDIVPYGDDFVNHFLQTSKKGNFAQFATATTLFYRAVGIPARYVAGYAVEAEQMYTGKWNKEHTKSKTRVKNANMYAWTEVYRDGIGWLVVDLAPSFSFEEMAEKYDTKENTTEATTVNIAKEYFGEDKALADVVGDKGAKLSAKSAVAVFGTALFLLVILGVLLLGYRLISYAALKKEQKLVLILDFMRKCLGAENGATPLDMCNRAAQLGVDKDRLNNISDLVQRGLYSEKGITSKDFTKLILEIFIISVKIVIVKIKNR